MTHLTDMSQLKIGTKVRWISWLDNCWYVISKKPILVGDRRVEARAVYRSTDGSIHACCKITLIIGDRWEILE